MIAEGETEVEATARRRGMHRPVSLAMAAAALLGLAGCGEPLHPSKWKGPPDEIPEGEGLLTGEDGEWIIYGA